MELETPHSVEFDLDRKIEDRIALMAQRRLTAVEEAEYVALLAQRSKLMLPPIRRRSRDFGRILFGVAV